MDHPPRLKQRSGNAVRPISLSELSKEERLHLAFRLGEPGWDWRQASLEQLAVAIQQDSPFANVMPSSEPGSLILELANKGGYVAISTEQLTKELPQLAAEFGI